MEVDNCSNYSCVIGLVQQVLLKIYCLKEGIWTIVLFKIILTLVFIIRSINSNFLRMKIHVWCSFIWKMI